MSFFGLFGHHDPAQAPTNGLPTPPPGAAPSAPATPQLPSVPPSYAKPSLFDKQHRADTLLALGTGLLSGFNFNDGMAAAGQNLMGLRQQLRAQQVKQHEYGGPDNAFEITIDPMTGRRTATPVPEFQDYLEQKRIKQRDVADINGRAMYALSTLPEDQRSAAYDHMLQNPDYYGIDPRKMPAHYDPVYVHATAGMGQTVAQATSAERADQAARDREAYRAQVQADRERRTGIYQDRAAATTRQGDARIAQGAERIGITKAHQGRKGGKISSHNSDLSYLLQ